MKKFSGITTEVLASFYEDGGLDENYIRNFTNFQIESGINGLFVNGLTPSETLCLSSEEKIRLAQVVCEQAAGRVPVMCNIITNSYRDGIRMAQEFAKAKSDAVCITPPMVYKMNNDALFEFFSRIIRESELPVYIYNQPLSGNPLSPEFIAKIAKEHPNVAGYKDSTNDGTHLQTLLTLTEGRDFDILTGSDSTIYSALTVGAVGGISYLSAIFPKLMLRITDAYFNGDTVGSFNAQQKALKVRSLLKKAPARSAYRLASKLSGHPMGYSKLPDAMLYPSALQEEEICAGLKDLGLI